MEINRKLTWFRKKVDFFRWRNEGGKKRTSSRERSLRNSLTTADASIANRANACAPYNLVHVQRAFENILALEGELFSRRKKKKTLIHRNR